MSMTTEFGGMGPSHTHVTGLDQGYHRSHTSMNIIRALALSIPFFYFSGHGALHNW